MKKRTKRKTLDVLIKPVLTPTKEELIKVINCSIKQPEFLTIKNAGLLDGKFSLELSNGCFLKGVTKIVTETPRYQDGVELHITIFVDTSKPIAVKT